MSEEHNCPMCAAGHPCITQGRVYLPAVDEETNKLKTILFGPETVEKLKSMGVDVTKAKLVRLLKPQEVK